MNRGEKSQREKVSRGSGAKSLLRYPGAISTRPRSLVFTRLNFCFR